MQPDPVAPRGHFKAPALTSASGSGGNQTAEGLQAIELSPGLLWSWQNVTVCLLTSSAAAPESFVFLNFQFYFYPPARASMKTTVIIIPE
jgi:hypothetical protein